MVCMLISPSPNGNPSGLPSNQSISHISPKTTGGLELQVALVRDFVNACTVVAAVAYKLGNLGQYTQKRSAIVFSGVTRHQSASVAGR